MAVVGREEFFKLNRGTVFVSSFTHVTSTFQSVDISIFPLLLVLENDRGCWCVCPSISVSGCF